MMFLFSTSAMLAFVTFLWIPQTKGFSRQSIFLSSFHSLRNEMTLSVNSGQVVDTAFIPRSQADLEEVLLGVAAKQLHNGEKAEESTVKFAKTISILPFQHTVNGYSGNLYGDFIEPYFRDNHYNLIKVNDTFSTKGRAWAPQFKVLSIEGYKKQVGEYYIIGPTTEIKCGNGVVADSDRERDPYENGLDERLFHNIADLQPVFQTDNSLKKFLSGGINENSESYYKYMATNSEISVFIKFVAKHEPETKRWLASSKENFKGFKKYVRDKYLDEHNLKALMKYVLPSFRQSDLTEEVGLMLTSEVIEIFMDPKDVSFTKTMIKRGGPQNACYFLFVNFARDIGLYKNEMILEDLKADIEKTEMTLGRRMREEGPLIKKHLSEKYRNCSNLLELLSLPNNYLEVPGLGTLSTPADVILLSSVSVETAIEYFTRINSYSFLVQMEQIGVKSNFASVIFMTFRDVMANDVPAPVRRWPFRAMIKTIITGVASVAYLLLKPLQSMNSNQEG